MVVRGGPPLVAMPVIVTTAADVLHSTIMGSAAEMLSAVMVIGQEVDDPVHVAVGFATPAPPPPPPLLQPEPIQPSCAARGTQRKSNAVMSFIFRKRPPGRFSVCPGQVLARYSRPRRRAQCEGFSDLDHPDNRVPGDHKLTHRHSRHKLAEHDFPCVIFYGDFDLYKHVFSRSSGGGRYAPGQDNVTSTVLNGYPVRTTFATRQECGLSASGSQHPQHMR